MNAIEALANLPPHVVGEVIGDILYTQPRPAPRHAVVTGGLLALLDGPFQRGVPGGWVFLIEPELHLGPDIVVPDLCAWRRERFVRWDQAFIDIAPDWVCEVLSPSTAAHDRGRKLSVYFKAEVEDAWLIDPAVQTLEAYCRGVNHWFLRGVASGNVRARISPFEAVELELRLLWEP